MTCSALGKWNVFGNFLDRHMEDCQTADLTFETETWPARAVFASFTVSE